MAILNHNVQQMLQRAPETSWVSRERDGAGVGVRWLLIASHVVHGRVHNYGICSTGEWTWEYADNRRIAPPENLIGFFPSLEDTRATAVSLLRSGIDRYDIPLPVILTFPMDRIVVAALQSSVYWRALAEKWLDAEYPPNDEIAALAPENDTVRAWARARLQRVFDME